MAKYKYILTVIIILCTIITYAQPAQYTPMTASGYQMKRLKVDSTLHLPSFCGVPNLRGSLVKEGALAIDTCGGYLYMWTRSGGWDTVNVSGGGGGSTTDTTSLSNRINLKIDSLKRSNDSVFAWINGVKFFQYTDSVGSGGGDFWKINGITTLTDDVFIQSDSIISFQGKDDEMKLFGVNSTEINLLTTTGVINLVGLNSTTDTSTYKPLGIDNNGKLSPLTSWGSGGGGGIDSLKRSSDSVYARKNGEFIFQFKDSVGGGSGSDTALVVIAQVHNATATTLLRGEVVYLFGANGDVASVKRANNKQDSTSSKTFGLVRRDIPSGGNGFITTQGQIEKLNLGTYTEGDVLWLDSIDGQFTKVKPQAPYHAVFLGVVERANNGNGLAYIKPQNGVELDEVHDVQINNIANNQIIVYSDTQQVWKNRNITSLIDTTVFQRRSIQTYSFLANNTPSTANAQALPFKDTSGVYTQSPVWGTSAPTGATNHTYRWTRIGNMVTLNISLVYGTVSTNNTALTIPLPTDCPTPVKPTGLTAASNFLYPGYCNGGNTLNTAGNLSARGGIRSNSANNGFEIGFSFVGNPFIFFQTTVTYYTN